MNRQTSSNRLLIIDDTPAIHEDFRKIFAVHPEAGSGLDAQAAAIFGEPAPRIQLPRFTIDSAHQGAEGFAAVQQALKENRPYCVAFVDMRLPPGWDGIETIKHLWAVDPRLQVVICTAHSDHSWQTICAKLQPGDNLIVLKKPFDQIEARQLAYALTRKWELTREAEARMGNLNAVVRVRTAELKRAEESFRQAFNASPLAQSIQSLETGRILEVNEAFVQNIGLAREKTIGLCPEDFHHGFDPVRWRKLMEELRQGRPVDEWSFTFLLPGGKPRDLRCSARLLKIEGERCAIWIVRDVTEQLQLEQQLRQSQKMEAVGQLAAGIAHDFNNLLTVIGGSTTLALLDNADPRLRTLLEPVLAASQRAAQLTRQLLLFSRKQNVQFRPLKVDQVINTMQPMLRRMIGANIDIVWDAPASLPPILSDESYLEQILLNLVVNARDAVPANGGSIRIGARCHEATDTAPGRSRAPFPRPCIEITVADNGAGIPAEILPRIFEPFFTTKEVGKGTGLGLSTVYSIVQQHKGRIDIDTQAGHGTTFRVFLPVLAPDIALPVVYPAREAAAGALPGWRVLLVDDDRSIRQLLGHYLKLGKFDYATASDSSSALAVWRQSPLPFDLLITDIIMPNGGNGIELARKLRALKPDLHVIIMTGLYDPPEDQGLILPVGAPPKLLLKPFPGKALEESIHELAAEATARHACA